MPKINCLESAKKAYQETLDKADIESTYDALMKHKQMAENAGANIYEDLNSFSKDLADAQERAAKIGMYRQVLKGQVLADNLLREENMRNAGFKVEKSVPESLLGKMTGSSWKYKGNRENSWTKQMNAVSKFNISLGNDLQNEGLYPYFTAKDGQKDIVQAMFDIKDGKEVDTPYGKLAKIFLKYQDAAIEKNKEVGIFISELDSRIAPNIHNPELITRLSRAERKKANALYPDAGNPHYEYAYQRWLNDIVPKIDHEKTFVKNNVNPESYDQVHAFMRRAFDSLINKGKSSQESVNYADKFKQQRVIHWKDASSLIDYNNQYGNGSIQDSIYRELAHQFGMVEVLRDWTINPMDAINSTLELMDENPATVQRFKKGNEFKEISRRMKSLTTREYPEFSAIATIGEGLRTFQTVTKLAFVTPKSFDDLAGTVRMARTLGYGRLNAYGNVIKRFMLGLSKDEKAVYAQMVETGLATKFAQGNRYNMNPYSPRRAFSWANHWAYKLGLLERWDAANKSYAGSLVGKFLHANRNVDWANMSKNDIDILGSYNIDEHDWSVIRKSSSRAHGNDWVITPDSIQDVSDEDIASALKGKGVENPTALRIANYKDLVEQKMTSFFRDRMNQAIISPDVVDRDMVKFEHNGTMMGKLYSEAIKNIMQFKHFGISWFRKGLLPILRENGATDNWESINPLSGKSNWKGLGEYGAERFMLGYVGWTVTNLALGLSPPSLAKTETWKKLVKQTLGSLDLVANISPFSLDMPKDVEKMSRKNVGLKFDLGDTARGVGNFVLGAAGSDAVKFGKLMSNLYSDSRKGMGYNKTKKSAYNLVKGGIPFNLILTRGLINHFFLNAMEDHAYPNKRQKDLRQIQQDTGAKKLF